jgi:hypothetical protein
MSLEDLEVGNNEKEINVIRQLIEICGGGFGLDGEPLPATHLVTHKINISTDKPIKTKQYRYPPKLKEKLRKGIDKLIEGNIIESASSQYCSLTWVMPKHEDKDRNKRWRLVTDFRQLNEITIGSCHPLPFTNELRAKRRIKREVKIWEHLIMY